MSSGKIARATGRSLLTAGVALVLAAGFALSRSSGQVQRDTEALPDYAPSARPSSEATGRRGGSGHATDAGEQAAGAGARKIVWFEGACDASGAVVLDERRLAVVDDEDNLLRVYDAERGGAPLLAVDLSPRLGLTSTKPESDIEAATRFGERAYFLTSHGRTTEGELDPDRFLFFATALPDARGSTAVWGTPCRSLIEELIEEPRFRAFELKKASLRAPKTPGGLNLEGLTASPEGSMLIGFRNPIPKGRALLVWLENPDATLAGGHPKFSAPILLDLGGLGVRSLSHWRDRYLIVAGPVTDGGPFRLYAWDGQREAQRVEDSAIEGLTPEAFFTPESRAEIMLLSDDGSRPIDGVPCKKLTQTERKRFRGLWLSVPRR